MHSSDRTDYGQLETPQALLNEVYRALGYKEGDLLDATNVPDKSSKDEWVNKGDWLSLAASIGAEKIFFVNNDPVIVFCAVEETHDADLLDLFRRFWCMARPQCLFLALPGELRVYSLNQAPAKDVENWNKILPLDVVRSAASVAERLQVYHREQVETGRLFHERQFGSVEQRADKRLIRDLKLVRQALLNTSIGSRYVHALIGRSIFIRYLEDRGILTYAYFEEVADQNPEWRALLSSQSDKPITAPNDKQRWFERVLQNKGFTYALFDKLTRTFNGDMFPRDLQEEYVVEQHHLNLLRRFLLGDVDPNQPSLFLWAYDFEIIPTELISSIYEEFYHENNRDDKGTHYTPSVLVDHVLSQVLTENCLAKNPRILDPACGSGIFLVEAFRRIVRYRVQLLGRALDAVELRQILQTQIAGIEINLEAIHVAAFSLYLALLHYQEPPDIRQNPRLPRLIFRRDQEEETGGFGILFNFNAFSLMDSEAELLKEKLERQSRLKERAKLQEFLDSVDRLPVAEKSFDVVVGNPPWGASKDVSFTLQKAWCKAFDWTIGDDEPSQAFIARTLALLKPHGSCGLLVSTGIFLKHLPNNEEFRRRWMEKCTLRTVVNFAHIRHVFFNADSPFAFVHFTNEATAKHHKIRYWSVKRTDMIDKLQVIVLSLPDLKQVEQSELKKHNYLWKTYWWGNHHDAALIRTLALHTSLGSFLEDRTGIAADEVSHRGYKNGSRQSGEWLAEFKELPISRFRRYGEVNPNYFVSPPDTVLHLGVRETYEGWRILFKRNPSEDARSTGRLVARLEDVNYCFSSSIFGFPVTAIADWERKILIGILWSSVARYFLFLVSSGWGVYHGEVLQTELMTLPIRMPETSTLRDQIVGIVERLMTWDYAETVPLKLTDSRPELATVEKQLDDAIFDLYELTQAERELVEDLCTTGFQLLYRKSTKLAISRVTILPKDVRGTISNLSATEPDAVSLQNYLLTFLQIWNRELEPNGEFSWRIIRAQQAPMIAVSFATQEKGHPTSHPDYDDEATWNELLIRCSAALRQPISERIYIDGMIRAVTDTEIIIVKRDERRLWTRSMAREDAEATIFQAMNLQQSQSVRG